MTYFIKPHAVSAYVVYRKGNKPLYLLLRRSGTYLTGTWQMVTGRIEEGETAGQAAFREIQEETGLAPKQIFSADAVETFYMQINDQIAFVPVFIAFVEEINVRLSPTEHDAYEWLPFEGARERLVWAEQKRVITQVHECSVLKTPSPHHLLRS